LNRDRINRIDMIPTKADSASVIVKNFVNPVRFFLSSWLPD